MADRYVLLGLAPARSEWFRAVSHWCNAAGIPAEFVKCVSPEQVRAALSTGRAVSAVLIDAAAPGLDRDLLDTAGRAGAVVLVVGPVDLPVAAVLPVPFGPDHLLDALAAHARPVGLAALDPPVSAPPVPSPQAQVVAACGSGGTGVSTVAIAAAQALAGSGPTLLADLRLHAEQAMLHDARDVVPGVQELVEAHRARTPSAAEVQAVTWRVAERGYDLLLGLRRARAWPALRPRAFEAAFASLRTGWRHVVCDVDADVEGERETGSADVEERNVMARGALAAADVVLVVLLPGMKGVHSAVRVIGDVVGLGVDPSAVVPVVNRAPRSPRARAEVAAALASLCGVDVGEPVFLPDRRVDDVLRDSGRLPPVLVAPIRTACSGVAPRRHGRAAVAAEPERIAPGSLGAWPE